MANLIVEGISYSPREFCSAFTTSDIGELRDIAALISDWNSGTNELTLHTSGSTGTPTLITMPRDAFVASAQLTASAFGLTKGINALLCLPVAYVAGKMMVIRALVNDWNLFWVAPSSHIKFDSETDIDFAAMTPMQVEASLSPSWPTIDKLIIGGSPLRAELEHSISTLTTACYETYGMTETLTHIAVRKVNGPNPEQRFYPLKGVQCELDDRGCLTILASHISSSVIVTNDVVEIDEDGSFKIIGRADNVINSGGVKLFPEKLEAKMTHLMHEAFYIKGEPNDQFGERAVLVIESQPWPAQQSETLLRNLRELFPPIQMPKAIYFQDPFDRTQSGKIIRR